MTSKVVGASPGMATQIWGPLAWALMNDVAVVAEKRWDRWSDSAKQAAVGFFRVIKHILPCKYCRASCAKFCHQSPPPSGPPFLPWVYRLHAKVNRKLKRTTPITLNDFYRRAHTWGAFGNAEGLWDLVSIVALNHPGTPRACKYYGKFLETMSVLVPHLIRVQNYNASARGVTHVALRRACDGRRNLFRAVRRERAKSSSNTTGVQDYETYVRRFAHAVADQTPEEIFNVCGPLLTRKSQQ